MSLTTSKQPIKQARQVKIKDLKMTQVKSMKHYYLQTLLLVIYTSRTHSSRHAVAFYYTSRLTHCFYNLEIYVNPPKGTKVSFP